MKYGIVRVAYYKQNLSDTGYICNLGDTCTTKSVEYILDRMEIEETNRVYVDVDDLWTYSGEYLICPINTIFFQKKEGHVFHQISDKIIPVFLSLSYSDVHISDKDVQYLKLYEPIGCRDEQTLKTMRKYGIKAYLNGCMVATFPKRERLNTQQKVFFIDVPYKVKSYVPEEIKKDITFIKQEIISDELPEGMTQLEWANLLLEKYKAEARLIVTSRFHAAVIGLALGIPTIIVNENYTYRFSWLRKLLPFYTRENFQNINWEPSPVDFEEEKERMLRIATRRISDAYDNNVDILIHSDNLETDYSNEVSLIDYYDEALEFVEKNWDKNKTINYAFWGVNNNAKAIYEYLNQRFPNVKLVKVYDSYRDVEFAGLKSVKPETIDADDHIFVFVTTFVAGYIAKEIFNRLGVPEKEYFICERKYVEERDL